MTTMGVTIEDLQCRQAGVQTRLPVVQTLGVAAGRSTLGPLVQLTSTDPAGLMGLYPRRWTVEPDRLRMDTDHRCWEGWERQARTRAVPLRGDVLIEDGNVVGSRTGGAFPVPTAIVEPPLDGTITAPRTGAAP